MKLKALLIVLITIIFSENLFSQSFSGGPVIGIVASQIDGDADGGYHKISYVVGGFVEYKFNENFSIQPEILLMQNGSKDTANTFNNTLNYIKVPILLNLKFDGKNLVNIYAGPSIGYLISANHKNYGGLKTDEADFYEKYELAANAGVSYFLNHKFGLDMRFSYSLTNIRNNGDNNYFISNSLIYVKNQAFNNYLTLSFRYLIE